MGTILTTPRHRYAVGLVIILVLNKTQRTNYLGFLTSLILLPPHITLRHLITPLRSHHYTFREHLCISIIRSVAAMRIKYCRQMMALSAKVATLIYRPTTSRIISTKCAGIWYGDADLDDNAAVILYVHGGGYCMGIPQQWPEAHQRMVDDLIRMGVPCRILALEYSLAPETAFPIAIQQVLLAYSYLTDDLHIRSSRIILAGDSAGGTLCIATALRMRDDELSMPAALVLISPWVDMYMTSPSYMTNRDDDLLLDTLLPQCSENYLQGHNMKDPSVSPIYADLNGLPPMCINAGGREIFYDDIMLFIDKARAAGVQITPIIDSSMVHTYPLWPLAFSSKAYHALHLMSTFISTILKARRVECNKEGSHHLTRNRFSDSHLI